MKKKYIYILSQPKGGSTLTSFLLNAHPEIFSVGETSRTTVLIPERMKQGFDKCSCGELYSNCDFWRKLVIGLSLDGFSMSSLDYFAFKPYNSRYLNKLYQLSYGELRSDWKSLVLRMSGCSYLLRLIMKKKHLLVKSFYLSFLNTVKNITGKNIYLDSSKSPIHLDLLRTHENIDLYVINLVRDGRAVVHSWATRSSENFMQLTYEQQIKKWLKFENYRKKLIEKKGVRVLNVSYEELCVNTKSEINRVMKFIGTDILEFDYSSFKTINEHHMTGNLMRLDNVEDITLDERWKTEADKNLIQSFYHSNAELINKGYGYSDSKQFLGITKKITAQ